jgi:uncharacterized protein (TIGR02588 family)
LKSAQGPQPVPGWHWALAALGGLLVLGAVGVLVREAVVSRDERPAVAATVERVDARSGVFVAQVRVENLGPTSLASVVVRCDLDVDGARESSEVVVDDLAGHSRRPVWFSFTSDPRRGRLRAQAVAFAAR